MSAETFYLLFAIAKSSSANFRAQVKAYLGLEPKYKLQLINRSRSTWLHRGVSACTRDPWHTHSSALQVANIVHSNEEPRANPKGQSSIKTISTTVHSGVSGVIHDSHKCRTSWFISAAMNRVLGGLGPRDLGPNPKFSSWFISVAMSDPKGPGPQRSGPKP